MGTVDIGERVRQVVRVRLGKRQRLQHTVHFGEWVLQADERAESEEVSVKCVYN